MGDLESVDQVPYGHQESRSTAQGPILGFAPDTALLRNLAIAIRAGMEAYQGQGSYEPSADELIDVLKNLENLAAANPALYKAIVDQISVCHSKCEDQNQNSVGNQPSHEQQRYAPQQTNGSMEQGHPQVDKHGSHEFIEWQADKQQLHKQKKLGYPPKVDRHGSLEFVEWQQKQQQLYKEMNGVAETKSLKPKIAYVEPTWKVDRHGSHGFVQMQQQQQLLHKQMKLKSPPKIDRHGSIEFVEWQQEQNQIYKEMSEVAEKK